jgi:DNA-directed RNA polymerase specialized sigma24 family protein
MLLDCSRDQMANNLPLSKKALILSSLVEGASIRSISRLTGASKTTILKLLVEAGERAAEVMDSRMVNIQSKRVQVDEI